MSRDVISTAVVTLCLGALVCNAGTRAVVVDHHCVDLSAIPDEYLPQAAAQRVLLRHASVGQGIGWGLDCLAGKHPTNSVCPDVPAGRYDRGNWVLEARAGNWRDKMDDLVSQTAARRNDFDVLMMKFCYIDALGSSHPDWEYCRSRMEQLEADYPDKTFVWWTITLTRDGQAGTDAFNAQVRSYCAAHHKILFDIADIECHDPDGTKLTNAQGNEVISQSYTKEIHAGHLNPEGRVRVASVLWYLMACVAGWDPNADEEPENRRIFVDAAGGRDDNNGLTLAMALATIQRGIDTARDGDTVIVSAGLYKEDVRFSGKNITVTSVTPERSDIVNRTVIDGTVYFRGTEDANCVLTGFRIGGSIVGFDPLTDPNGVHHTHATISHCVLENIMSGCGGVMRNCDGAISHCVIANIGYMCRRAWPISGIIGCHGLIRNCTIVDAADGIEILEGGACTIENSIIYGGSALIVREGGTLTVAYSDVEGGRSGVFGTGTMDWGPGNIDVFPCFVRVGSEQEPGDYHLKSAAGRWDPERQQWVQDDVTSRCIDAADPAADWTAEPWPHGKRMNMGAYGGTAEASLSLSVFGSSAGPVLVPFELRLGQRAAWAEGHQGFDPNLPGYHVVGEIASVALKALTDQLPDELVLAIRTSPGMPPMLQNFTLTGPHVKLSGEPFNPDVGLTYFERIPCLSEWRAVPEVDAKLYVRFAVAGDEVLVTFLPPAIDLLKAECTISWIDWYR